MAAEPMMELLVCSTHKGKRGSPFFEEKYIINKKTELRNAVNEIISVCDKSKLVLVIGLSNAHYCESEEVPKGVVFVTKGSMPASMILGGYNDLVGGVSIYAVAPFGAQGNADTLIGDYMQQIVKKKNIIFDKSLLPHQNASGIALGKIGCSVGVYRSKSRSVEDMEDYWHIIVRSYYTEGSVKLMRTIENENLTMADLESHEQYKELMHTSDMIRDAIAAKFAAGIGAKLVNGTRDGSLLGEKVTLATSYCVNRYNVVQKFGGSGDMKYAFYAGCYGLAEGTPPCIAFGLGPTKGYELINYGNGDATPFGSSQFAYGFPMGVPKKIVKDLAIVEGATDPLRKFMYWGGRFTKHCKVHESLYESDFYEQPKGRKHIHRFGGFTQPPATIRAIPRGVYINSPSELDATITSLLEFDKAKNEIPIAKAHEFIDHYLIQGWRLIEKIDSRVKLYNDIIKNEDEIYIYLSADRLKQMMKFLTASENATVNGMKTMIPLLKEANNANQTSNIDEVDE